MATAGGPYPWILINALARTFPEVVVVEEEPESRGTFLRRRARLVGWVETIGQFFTMVLSRLGKRFARRREREILAAFPGADPRPDPAIRVIRVPSVNAPEFAAALADLAPAVLLLAGCRILKPATLSAIPCPVLNFHSGITPKYRGMQNGYWARLAGDRDHYGTTIHLVDEGVDTGGVVRQLFLDPDPRETMLTDAMLMAAASQDMVIGSVGEVLAGRLDPRPAEGVSTQYFHPPIWAYLANGIARGVW